jgi:hypothetical protein
MKKKHPHHSQAPAEDPLCAEPRENDGIPPSVLAKCSQQEHRHVNYHGEQLGDTRDAGAKIGAGTQKYLSCLNQSVSL